MYGKAQNLYTVQLQLEISCQLSISAKAMGTASPYQHNTKHAPLRKHQAHIRGVVSFASVKCQARDPVTPQQGVRQREREVWTQNVWRPLLKYVIGSGEHGTNNLICSARKLTKKLAHSLFCVNLKQFLGKNPLEKKPTCSACWGLAACCSPSPSGRGCSRSFLKNKKKAVRVSGFDPFSVSCIIDSVGGSAMFIPDPNFPIPNPGSKRHRHRNPDPQHW